MTKTPAWTPGPWKPYSAPDCVDYAVVDASNVDVAEICSVPFMTMEQQEANAALIAAAPDLYEALEQLLSVMDVDGPITEELPDQDSVGWDGKGNPLPMTFGHVRRAVAALKKARGET